MTLRIGIIGAGWIGRWHAARWGRLPVRLMGFYDVDSASADSAAAQYGGRAFASVEQLIESVDVVQVCTPSSFHRVAVLAAAAAGKHIFCEKPLARTLEDARAIIEGCERAGVRLFVGQVLRFFPQYRRAKALVEAGAVGTPGMIRLLRAAGHPATSAQRAWFRSVEQTGGCALEGGIHDLDFARWTLGDIETVFTRGLSFRDDFEFPADHVFITLRFTSGVVGHVEQSWMVTDGRFRQRFEIGGDRGLLTYDSLPPEPFAVSLRSESRPALLPAEPISPDDEPYYRQLAHFLDCLLRDQPFLVSPHDGLAALRLSLAALESLRRGEPVPVEEMV